MTPAAPRRRRWPLGVLLATVGVLVAGELLARLLPAPPDRRSPLMGDPHVVARPRPGWQGGQVRINAQGFRDDAPVEAKAAGERRVLVLGDSLVWAQEVSLEDSFPERLERLLGQGARCVNAGVPAYTTVHERRLLELEGPKVQPDVVLLVVSIGTDTVELCQNDEELSPARRTARLEPGLRVAIDVAEPEGPKEASASERLAQVSALWARLRATRLYQALRSNRRGPDGLPRPLEPEKFRAARRLALATCRRGGESEPPLREAWALFGREVARLKALCDGLGARLVVTAVPDEAQVDPAVLEAALDPGERELLDLELPQRMAAAACARAGVRWVDLLPALRAGGGKVFAERTQHLDGQGHERVAAALAAQIREALTSP